MATQQTTRVYNFSAGPAVMPVSVLERIQAEMLCLPGAGASILEISHRSKPFVRILESAESRIRRLLGVPDNYKVLFLQGGSRLQFSMIPLNLFPGGEGPAEYLLTGSWSKYAIAEAKKVGETRTLWDGKESNYDRFPGWSAIASNPRAPYFYFTSNETIQGVQAPTELPWSESAPVVCDSSSDFLSRPVPVSQYGLLYACAQKNAGPAGVTVVIIRDDLLDRAPATLPGYLLFREHSANQSMYNTPPTFAIYALDLVCQWIQEEVGGLAEMARRNEDKARLLYDVIDDSDGFYQGHAQTGSRSVMNVAFRLQDPSLDARFLSEAAAQGMENLEGHRSVGGMRASIYNAMPREGVDALAQFMRDFQARA